MWTEIICGLEPVLLRRVVWKAVVHVTGSLRSFSDDCGREGKARDSVVVMSTLIKS